MSFLKKVQVKNLDHLGIVAGIIDEIGIVEIINSKLGTDCREKITAGQIVKAIIVSIQLSAISYQQGLITLT